MSMNFYKRWVSEREMLIVNIVEYCDANWAAQISVQENRLQPAGVVSRKLQLL